MEKKDLDRKLQEANASIANLHKGARNEHKNDFKFEELNDIDFKGNILKLGKNIYTSRYTIVHVFIYSVDGSSHA